MLCAERSPCTQPRPSNSSRLNSTRSHSGLASVLVSASWLSVGAASTPSPMNSIKSANSLCSMGSGTSPPCADSAASTLYSCISHDDCAALRPTRDF